MLISLTLQAQTHLDVIDSSRRYGEPLDKSILVIGKDAIFGSIVVDNTFRPGEHLNRFVTFDVGFLPNL